jgi:hypothetical protein
MLCGKLRRQRGCDEDGTAPAIVYYTLLKDIFGCVVFCFVLFFVYGSVTNSLMVEYIYNVPHNRESENQRRYIRKFTMFSTNGGVQYYYGCLK